MKDNELLSCNVRSDDIEDEKKTKEDEIIMILNR